MRMPQRLGLFGWHLWALLPFALELPGIWLKCAFCQAAGRLHTLGKRSACIQMPLAGQQMWCQVCRVRCTHSIEWHTGCGRNGLQLLQQRIQRYYVHGVWGKLFCNKKSLWEMRRCNDIFNCIDHCGRGHCDSCSCRCGHLALDAPFYPSRSTAQGTAEGAGANPSPAMWLGENNSNVMHQERSNFRWKYCDLCFSLAQQQRPSGGFHFVDILGGGFYTPSLGTGRVSIERLRIRRIASFWLVDMFVLMHIVWCFDFPIAAKVSFGQSWLPKMVREEHSGKSPTSKPCSCQWEASRVLSICSICNADSKLGLSSCARK